MHTIRFSEQGLGEGYIHWTSSGEVSCLLVFPSLTLQSPSLTAAAKNFLKSVTQLSIPGHTWANSCVDTAQVLAMETEISWLQNTSTYYRFARKSY